MNSEELLDRLGYAENPHFLRADAGNSLPYWGHVLRHAQKDLPRKLSDASTVLGVYTLEQGTLENHRNHVPLVYVCHVDDESLLPELHRLIWCQDIVPFVLVHTPRGIQLHSGFRYKQRSAGSYQGVLQPLRDFNLCRNLIEEFSSSSIDSGAIWQIRRKDVTPNTRVDWELLRNLKLLEKRLHEMALPRETSHALIGKFVFLRYLRDREILSDRKFESWGLDSTEVFGRNVKAKTLKTCIEEVEVWLNGGIFPIDWKGANAPKAEHIRAVAATFAGDIPVGEAHWQLSFDFLAYDFSYIPIETLSVIYEQFLHAPADTGESKGKSQGAYYTPIHLVNLMLSQLEQYKPIEVGTRILDPSCGSGAFLVQAYRRLIETALPANGRRRTPTQLRELLTKHIFGVDRDPDACSVTELSLQMTLLDYVNPPDLEATPAQQKFELPTLRGANIVHADFFDDENETLQALKRRPFGLVVGNPPWKSINPKKLIKEDNDVWEWIKTHGLASNSPTPVSGNQMAQAFIWKLLSLKQEEGGIEAALLIPGMTLFEDRSKAFRRRYFSRFDVRSVMNFANLAEVLFAGRSRVPAAAFFFHLSAEELGNQTSYIRVCSPLVANQEANRGTGNGDRPETWSIEIQESDFRDVDASAAISGSGLPWKVAQWGSHLDVRLLARLKKRFPTLGQLEGKEEGSSPLLLVSEGLQLRKRTAEDLAKSSGEDADPVEEIPQVVGKPKLDVKQLERLRHIFRFPEAALKEKVEEGERFVRKRGGKLPLKVCRPPHVIVSAARTFAVYTDEYLIVPPRQIGIVHLHEDREFLKALSLYLSSDFAFYHQFFTTPEFGVKRDRATLKSLRDIPVPLVNLQKSELQGWSKLYSELTQISPTSIGSKTKSLSRQLFVEPKNKINLLNELNNRVVDVLKLSEREQALVHDLVHVRLNLKDGQIGAAATASPSPDILKRYASRLAKELNAIVGDTVSRKYVAEVVHNQISGIVILDFVKKSRRSSNTCVRSATQAESKELALAFDHLREEFSQWVYLNRNLRIYDGRRTYIFKPLQRFHWTESQAMSDAAEIVSETLSAGENR